MKLNEVKKETLFLLAKNAWSAKRILSRVRNGEIAKDSVLFATDTLAYRRWSHLPIQKQKVIDVFKVNWEEREI